MKRRHVIVIVDNVDIDNTVAALAACHFALGLYPCAVIVTGRPAHPDRNAPMDASDFAYSKRVRQLNTCRLKGFLKRAGRNIPVFEGLIPPATVVPHNVHIDERKLDEFNDMRKTLHDGDFAAAVRFLCELDGQIDVIVGGPLSEAAMLMNTPQLASRLGTMTCQLGRFGDVVTMAGEGRTFNSAAAPMATATVLAEWPGEVYLVPTDVTKRHSVGFDDPADLRSFGFSGELLRLYDIFWRKVLLARDERIYPHDVHPVYLMAQLRGAISRPLYNWETVRVEGVDSQGRISVAFGEEDHPKRYVVRDVDPGLFRDLLSVTTR